MKRTQARVVLGPRLLQGDVFTHHADNVRLQLKALREVGREGHATLGKIVSQSGAVRNIAEGDCCEEAVESTAIQLTT